ncbi:hypothetical protein BDW62DRAFT_11869 [Aspergillus aurantiobrunneus]
MCGAVDRKRQLYPNTQNDSSQQKRGRTKPPKFRTWAMTPNFIARHCGTIVSGQVYPLIFTSTADDDDEVVRLRTLSFFEDLLADIERGRDTYQSVSTDIQRIVAVGVRDIYLAACQGHSHGWERNILDGMVQVIGEPVECKQVNGMRVSSVHPWISKS